LRGPHILRPLAQDNFQIMRDLSFLLIQMRNYEGFTVPSPLSFFHWVISLIFFVQETRRLILNSRQTQKASWVGLAVAYYVEGDLEQALSVIDAYENTLPV